MNPMSSNYCTLLAGDREELSRGGRLHGREERLLRRQPQGRRPAELLPRRNPQGTEQALSDIIVTAMGQ